MRTLRVDLHIHTAASADSRMSLAQAAAAAARRGVDALAVCDHNRCAPRSVFEEPVLGGVLLLPGVEYSTERGHLLGLCLRAPCSVDGERGGRVRFADAAAAIHAAGGLCVLAHPFELTQRSAAQIQQSIAELAPLLDGVEGYNCRASKKRADANALAQRAGTRHGLFLTAGSDAHTPAEVGGACMTLNARELSVQAVREALQANAPLGFSCGRCRHMAIAKSRWMYLRSTRAGLADYLQWPALAGVCMLRTVKGWFL